MQGRVWPVGRSAKVSLSSLSAVTLVGTGLSLGASPAPDALGAAVSEPSAHHSYVVATTCATV